MSIPKNGSLSLKIRKSQTRGSPVIEMPFRQAAAADGTPIGPERSNTSDSNEYFWSW
jgi:hypothetical protein